VPRPFDPALTRQSFERSGLEVIDILTRESPEFRGNAALGNLQSIVYGWLVGLADRLDGPLRILAQWFEQADSANERFADAPHFYAAMRNDAWGLCTWMLSGHADPRLHRLAVGNWELHFEREGKKLRRGAPKVEDPWIRGIPFEAKDILHGSLADYLASCVQCREFARGAALYEKVGGKTDIADARVQTDIHLGYWLCKQGSAGHIPVDACAKIGSRVLRANLRTRWLGMGQAVRAATWLKIVAEFAGWNLPAREVILRAYEFMPGVTRPS
jgi:hypothetical protein